MPARPVVAGAAALVAAGLLAGCGSGGGSGDAADRPSTTATSSPPVTGPGSRDQPIALGTAADVTGQWRVKVVSTLPDATAELRQRGQPDAAPPAGRQFFLATLEITYLGGGSASPQSTLTFTAVDQEGTYSEATDGCGTIPEPIPASDVLTGATARGSVCWAVRPGALASLLMVVESGFLRTGSVHFKLQ